MSTTKKRTFKEIRQRVSEIIKRPPTAEQLEDLRNTFVKIEEANKKAQREENDSKDEHKKKIARDPELGM
jgi:hypothetical protein